MISSVTVSRSPMNQNEVGTWHHHSRTTPALLFSRNTKAPQSRSEPAPESGIGFTAPPQTNSEMLRGPLSGQLRTFMLATVFASLRTLTLALSRFAVEGTPSVQRHNRVPSTAKRERARVRVCDS